MFLLHDCKYVKIYVRDQDRSVVKETMFSFKAYSGGAMLTRPW